MFPVSLSYSTPIFPVILVTIIRLSGHFFDLTGMLILAMEITDTEDGLVRGFGAHQSSSYVACCSGHGENIIFLPQELCFIKSFVVKKEKGKIQSEGANSLL